MEIDVQSGVSGSPSPRRVRTLLRSIERLTPAPGSGRPPRGSEISVLFCGDTRMRSLNRRYRRKDRSTDVLAFPGGGGTLGDIVVSVPYAGREARRRRETAAREIDRLLLHGYLHLMGYDHETDRGEMDALEAKLARRLGLPSDFGAPARGAAGGQA